MEDRGRGDLTHAQWERLRPYLPVGTGRCGRWRDHRQVINGVLHRIRTGVPWRDLPHRYGPWKTVSERHRRWSEDGTWALVLHRLQAEADAEGDIDWEIAVDSTSVRAHQHAAGARRTVPMPLSSGRHSAGGLRPGVGKAVAPVCEGDALGRSRGGFTTKIHLSADGRCRVLSLVLTQGQRADCTQFEAVMRGIRVPRIGAGRPRSTPSSVSADRAYSSRAIRQYLRRRGIRHSIPEKSDQAANRRLRGHAGGRPPGFDRDRCRKRNTVERAVSRLKNYRAVATRYDKRAYVYLGTVTVAAFMIWLRT
ncbi:IS5 family transposase [Kitasatospora sp. NBC_01287]|uniref:IS5 family transposase n=1 Tax=Kitasatospora sp. NBC_01287 TaxID=2903573 RepID=UPI0022593E13|nr:IS5 family transposase [Kitasatospora sp. NBC_01287]MCX4749181.1 IS5 family transposase [Kitasatospora sp. NBC_01287]